MDASRTTRLGRALAFVIALLTCLACRAGEPAQELRAVVDETIGPLMSRHDIPGIAVALSVDGRAYVFNRGVASRERQTPVTDATLFEIGSISKMFTTTLAAWAQAQGRLSLDDHPGRYLAQLRGRPIDRATLLNLGTYTAGGLPLQFPDAVRSEAEALAFLRDWKADAAPGAVRRYSNPSIGLLGAVVAAAMKEPFADLVETRLLPGFGMSHTHLHVPPNALADYAWGERDDKPVRVRPGPMGEPAYGIKATAADMIRFVQANLDPSGLEASLRRAVEATQVGRFAVGAVGAAGGMVQGFGWEQFAYPLSREALLAGNADDVIFEPNAVQPAASSAAGAPRLYDKTGSTNGFGAYVAFVPARRIGLVLLANKNFPIPARIEVAYAILQRLDPGLR